MKPRIHVKSVLLGVVVGAFIAFFVALAVQPGDGPCWLHVKNTGTRSITVQPMGGQLPLRTSLRFGFLPVPQRKEYWGRLLQPGESGSVPYGPGATITVMDLSSGVGRSHPVWTGTARALVAEVNADDITNITFQVTSQSQ